MNENRRNLIVAIFVIAGLVVLGWMVFKFGDLPTIISRYDAREITIYFSEAMGIQENTAVLFRGYRVGKVIQVHPPALLEDLENSEKKSYQVEMVIAISKDYYIPANVTPKVYRRGLGGSFVELSLEESPSAQMLQNGDKLKGMISEASEFISEKTQRKLDQLISSLTILSDQFKGQLTPLPPDKVDSDESDKVHPNITTAVMRLDRSLKYLNVFLGDVENQQNFKKGLVSFADLSDEIRDIAMKVEDVTIEAKKLIEKATQTISNVGEASTQVSKCTLSMPGKKGILDLAPVAQTRSSGFNS